MPSLKNLKETLQGIRSVDQQLSRGPHHTYQFEGSHHFTVGVHTKKKYMSDPDQFLHQYIKPDHITLEGQMTRQPDHTEKIKLTLEYRINYDSTIVLQPFLGLCIRSNLSRSEFAQPGTIGDVEIENGHYGIDVKEIAYDHNQNISHRKVPSELLFTRPHQPADLGDIIQAIEFMKTSFKSMYHE
jgi:hypothetical protein